MSEWHSCMQLNLLSSIKYYPRWASKEIRKNCRHSYSYDIYELHRNSMQSCNVVRIHIKQCIKVCIPNIMKNLYSRNVHPIPVHWLLTSCVSTITMVALLTSTIQHLCWLCAHYVLVTNADIALWCFNWGTHPMWHHISS